MLNDLQERALQYALELRQQDVYAAKEYGATVLELKDYAKQALDAIGIFDKGLAGSSAALQDKMDEAQTFKEELASLINRHCLENLCDANVPDFILAQAACDAINSFMAMHKDVKEWYGVHLEPGNSYFKKENAR